MMFSFLLVLFFIVLVNVIVGFVAVIVVFDVMSVGDVVDFVVFDYVCKVWCSFGFYCIFF